MFTHLTHYLRGEAFAAWRYVRYDESVGGATCRALVICLGLFLVTYSVSLIVGAFTAPTLSGNTTVFITQ
jgi:hypothetical protein